MRVHGRICVTAAALLLLAMASACRTRDHDVVQARHVDIVAPDGVLLRASYFSPGKAGPAVLLFHQCSMDRHAWDGLAIDLVTAGFHVLTYDQRGFGASRSPGRYEPEKLDGDG